MRVGRNVLAFLVAGGLTLTSSIVHAQATATYTYDEAGRLRGVSDSDGGTTTYTLDAAGNRSNVSTVVPSPAIRIYVPVGGYTVPENGGTLTISVRRIGPASGTASVNFNAGSGTATSGTDFSITPGTLSWASGEGGTKTFNVTITNDSAYEGANETFNVAISNAAGVPLGSPSSTTVTIVEDDPPPPGQLQLSASSYSVGESAGPLTISVTRTGGSFGAASINYSTTAGTATAPADYTTTSGTLNWANGDAATKTFNIPIVNDPIVEGSHAFTVTLSGATGASAGSTLSAPVTITEPPPGVLNITPVTTTVNEGTATVGFTVTRTGGSYGNISVTYATANGTATAGSDYTAASGTLSWTNGETASKGASIAIINNTVGESNETFTVALSGAIGATIGASTSTITIEDNETGTLQFSSTASVVAVESVGNVTLSVTRTNGAFGTASVLCSTANGFAVAGQDYTAVSTTLTWANGDSSTKSCTVPITNDSLLEHSYCWGVPDCSQLEHLFVNLSNASGAPLGTGTQVVIGISDDEPLPWPTILSFSASSYSVAENGGSVTITVNRAGTQPQSGPATTNYSVGNASATAGSDFTAVSGTLSWAAGEGGAKTFTVPILDDSIYEGSSEGFLVAISGATGDVASPSGSNASVIITENDPDPGIQIYAGGFAELPAHSSVYGCYLVGGQGGWGYGCYLRATNQAVYTYDQFGLWLRPGYMSPNNTTLWVTPAKYGQY
jgi:YD repeat-containing protein